MWANSTAEIKINFDIVAAYSSADVLLDAWKTVETSGDAAIALVVVEEIFLTAEGNTLSRTVTYSLKAEDEMILITGVSVELTGETSTPIPSGDDVVFYQVDAESVVDAYFADLYAGDLSSARSRVSDRFAEENPQLFEGTGMARDVQWEILGSDQLSSDRFRVIVAEQWGSGPETFNYQLVVIEGVLLIDTSMAVDG